MKISKVIADHYGFSVRLAKKYIKEGIVSLDGVIVKKDEDIESGNLSLAKEFERPECNPSDYIVTEFENLVFFDKPAFMHTDLQKPDDPLTMQDVLHQFSHDFKFISRLDYTTDGIICAVREDFFVFDTKKIYLAYVHGEMKDIATIDNLIDADKKKKVKVLDQAGGHKTTFTPLEFKDGYTLVQAEMVMAARHQLRAYLAYLGHPIVGDFVYGDGGHKRVMLHCKETFVNGFPGASNLTKDFIL
ncbi:MAG: hypothetical protein C0603_02965 [Denitrovibrio sp.]|nr:MAG: hypothetical protein C0603_02965 [Denitrovibrio sp.]